MRSRLVLPAAIFYVAIVTSVGVCQDQPAVALPEGVKAVWDLSKAYRETTPTRERICINGLWRWQPAASATDQPPTENWGYVKVPGPWPGGAQGGRAGGGQGGRGGGGQTGYPHPNWKSAGLSGGNTAWYQREIDVPNEWGGRRITVTAECVYSRAIVYLDGKKVGEMLYPWGEVDLTSACRPGSKHVLSMAVAALPLRDVVTVFNDSAAPRQAKGTVARRGLNGDVYLVGAPAGPRIADVKISTSVRKGEITFDTALQGLTADATYVLRSLITDKGNKVVELTSKPFQARDLTDGRIAATEKWKPDKLWDTIAPQNQYDVSVSLREDRGKVLDTRPARPLRLPRVLDRRPRFLPQRHPYLFVGHSAQQRQRRARAGDL